MWAGHARRASREPRGRSRNLTPEEVARIHQLRAEGLPLAAIADRLGVGVTTVGRRARLAVQSG
ncbi:helix-turn-helix domain-containing protein [Microbacterium proteolyticum]|uniref:helix-turn-helix domain-containing protein n=1 Tax=Microbacterium proteolyticum TaxID=1572644 RepID=UPI0035A8F205